MRTLDELLNSEVEFHGEWKKDLDVFKDFEDYTYNSTDEEILKEFEGIKLLFTYYSYEDYYGEAFVLFTKNDGKLYIVQGSHCSCYGLEGQWQEEETTIDLLEHYFKNGEYEYKDYGDELKLFIGLKN